jgi:ABC-type glycerol-3-phosphate transport system substrate-binding protein
MYSGDEMPIRKFAGFRGWMLPASIALIIGTAACQSIPGNAPTAGLTDKAAFTPQPSATVSPTPSAGISALTVWLPPAFRSDSNSPGGNVLQARIEAFETLHPGLHIVVRVKAAAGSGGLRDSLAAAAAAAPGALPDVVALDQSNLRASAIKSLIYPLDGLVPQETWTAYFPFAGAMAVVDNRHFGLPFAGDAVVLANTLVPSAEPQRWEETYAWTNSVVLPLGDSRSLFLFFGYYAAGGAPMLSIADAQIDPVPLEQELLWLDSMQESGVLSLRSTQIDSFESSFLAIENFGECAATLYSIASASGDYFPGYLPTPRGEKFSLASGWAWAVATPDPLRQAKASELLAWLTDPQFLAEWTQAQGVIPTMGIVLATWPASARKTLLAGMMEKAQAFPDDEISAFAGPVLAKAARRVLLEGSLPADAAAEAAKAIHP